jgi:hypothetical protein
VILSALWFLQSRSVVNALRARILRLRQPKYLVGAVVGAGYLWMVGFRQLLGFGTHPGAVLTHFPEDFRQSLEAGITLLLVVWVVLVWVFTGDRASLRFTEAEVAFLFPAPMSRKTLIHFRLLRLQAGTLFSAVFFSVITGRALRDGHALFHIAGWWLVLATMGLHGLAASFAIQRLTERGLSGWRRRLCVLAGFTAVCGLAFWWARTALSGGPPSDPQEWGAWLRGILSAGPAPWLLAPFRCLVRPWFAADLPEFLRFALPALAVLIAHYIWVVRADVSFEEASIDASRRLAERIAAVRSGRGLTLTPPSRSRRDPFRLAPVGFPPMALLWKNLISAGQLFTVRFWFLMLWMTVVGGMVGNGLLQGSGNGRPIQMAAAGFVGVMLVLTFLLGPQLLRNDFRSDLTQMDWMKSLPLPPWQIALGQLLAPVCLMVGFQWLLLVLLTALSAGLEPGWDPPLSTWRGPVIVSVALLLPPMNLLLLALPNAAALVFPAWIQPAGGRHGGIEVIGQRLIFVLGQMLVLALALLPAAGVGWLTWWLASGLLGPVWAVPVAAVAVFGILAGEGAMAIRGLGFAFARFDLSAEG